LMTQEETGADSVLPAPLWHNHPVYGPMSYLRSINFFCATYEPASSL